MRYDQTLLRVGVLDDSRFAEPLAVVVGVVAYLPACRRYPYPYPYLRLSCLMSCMCLQPHLCLTWLTARPRDLLQHDVTASPSPAVSAQELWPVVRWRIRGARNRAAGAVLLFLLIGGRVQDIDVRRRAVRGEGREG